MNVIIRIKINLFLKDKENVQTEEEKTSNESLLKSDQMLKSFLKIVTIRNF
jgi:hypothetical protein